MVGLLLKIHRTNCRRQQQSGLAFLYWPLPEASIFVNVYLSLPLKIQEGKIQLILNEFSKIQRELSEKVVCPKKKKKKRGRWVGWNKSLFAK